LINARLFLNRLVAKVSKLSFIPSRAEASYSFIFSISRVIIADPSKPFVGKPYFSYFPYFSSFLLVALAAFWYTEARE
jgi:hypothetical protein